MLDLEEDILRVLDFNLSYTGPIWYLERYIRLFDLDQLHKDITSLSKGICRIFLRSNSYLRFKPSHIAAAALTLAFNISRSTYLRKHFEVEPVPSLMKKI